jgi:environmental stress-induced protein Ves
MIRHLSQADFRVQPWANGRGQTVELARSDDASGLRWRLSVATVAETGAFSLFPGIDRVLTVITGPGFLIRGESIDLHALPFRPVAFPGDVAVAAEGVAAPSEDFNVMVARYLGAPEVWLPETAIPAGGLLALFAPEGGRASGLALAPGDLLLTDGALGGLSGQLIAARLPLD